MRNIYSTPSFNKFEQGMIFNGAIASNYKGRKVYGIVITPRCDITHKKNNEIHYLPVVSLNDWLAVDGKNLLVDKSKAAYYSKLKSELLNKKIDHSILINNRVIQLYGIIEKLIPQKDKRKNIIECLTNIEIIEKLAENILTPSEVQDCYKKEGKHIKAIIKDLTENNKKDYYLIDPIDKGNDTYYVVLNREIKRLDFSIAEQIHKGIFISEINKENSNYCDIDYNNQEDFIAPVAIMKSPYMEHLIQHFILNFNRIGVIDHDNNLPESLTSKIKYDEILIY